MATYKTLKAIFHQHSQGAAVAVERELEARRANPATVSYPYSVGEDTLFVVGHRELLSLQESIWRGELRVNRLWDSLPLAARRNYLMSLLAREIQASNDIEAIYSTRQEVEEALREARGSESRGGRPSQRRFVEMARTYSLLFEGNDPNEGFPRTLAELRKRYDGLLSQEIAPEDRLDGELFRNGTVSVVDASGRIVHRGAESEAEIKLRLLVMLEVNGDSRGANLIDAVVGHFMFEHVHPFYDGNGRFGRFLLAARLGELLSAPTALSLSAEVMQHKNQYYSAFEALENPMLRGEATFFVVEMLKMLLSAQQTLIGSLADRFDKLNELLSRIDGLGREQNNTDSLELSLYHLEVMSLLGQVYLFGPRSGVTLQEVSSFVSKSKGTIRPVLADLESKNLLDTLSRKPLIFALSDKGRDFLHLDPINPV